MKKVCLNRVFLFMSFFAPLCSLGSDMNEDVTTDTLVSGVPLEAICFLAIGMILLVVKQVFFKKNEKEEKI